MEKSWKINVEKEGAPWVTEEFCKTLSVVKPWHGDVNYRRWQSDGQGTLTVCVACRSSRKVERRRSTWLTCVLLAATAPTEWRRSTPRFWKTLRQYCGAVNNTFLSLAPVTSKNLIRIEVTTFHSELLTLLVGSRIWLVKQLGVGLMMMTISLDLCTYYSSGCHHHFHHP